MRDNPFRFDLYCTIEDMYDSRSCSERRGTLQSLYDVFVNVRDDEKEH